MALSMVNNAYSSSSFKSKRLMNTCENFIKNNISDECEIKFITKVNDFYFEEDGVFASLSADMEILKGITTIKLGFYKNEELLNDVIILIKIDIYKNIPTATRDINSGETLKRWDIKLMRQLVSEFDKNEVLELYKLIGNKLKYSIRKDSAFSSDYFEIEKIIEKGDKVNLVVPSGAIQVRANGIALNDAGIGEKIKVKRSNAKRILQGKVSEDGKIIIEN